MPAAGQVHSTLRPVIVATGPPWNAGSGVHVTPNTESGRHTPPPVTSQLVRSCWFAGSRRSP